MGMADIIDQWAEEEDAEVMGVMAKLYGPFMQYTLIFPSWKGPNVVITLGLIACFTFMLPVHFLILGISIARGVDRFDLMSTALHYFLIFAFAQTALIFLNKDRVAVARVHRLMASDLGNYRTGRIYDEDKPQTYEKGKRRELMRFLCLPGIVCLASGGALIVPYIKKLSQEKSKDESHYTSGGLNLNLPIAAYYPFPTHTGLFHLVAVLGQLVTGAGLALVICCLEVLLFRVSQNIIVELKVLQYGMETLFPRAEKLYKQTYPWRGNDKLRTSDLQFQNCIGLCFKDIIEHHHRIAELLRGFEDALKWPAAMAYTFGTGAIGLSLINILDAKETNNYENLCIFSIMMFGEVLNMYIISVFGEDITTESKVLRDVLYDIDWHLLDTKNRRMMLGFQIGITKPVIVKAGGLAALCMDTFSSIMNTSYSFFNLVNAQTN